MPAWRGLIVLAGAIAAAPAVQGDAGPQGDARTVAGARVYQQHCAACHGAQGEGAPDWQRPDARGELPPPPHGPAGHTWRHDDATLYRMISEGWRDRFNKTSRLTMPAFKDVLTDEEIEAVIEYLKTLWTPEQRRRQAELTRRRAARRSR